MRSLVAAGVFIVLCFAVLGPEKTLALILKQAAPGVAIDAPHDRQSIPGQAFALCAVHPYTNCVIDGDTFYLERQPIRLEGIDTPETHPARCDYEARLGAKATHRLHELLNQGPFELEQIGRQDHDQYGRKLRMPVRDGKSFGSILVAERLARTWTGKRLPWCD